MKIKDIGVLPNKRGHTFTAGISVYWKNSDQFKMCELYWWEKSLLKRQLPAGYTPSRRDGAWTEMAHGTPRVLMFADFFDYQEQPGGTGGQRKYFSITDKPQFPKQPGAVNRMQDLKIIVVVKNSTDCDCDKGKKEQQVRFVRQNLVVDKSGDLDFSDVRGKPKSYLREITDPKLFRFWPKLPNGLQKPKGN